jgi:hypothetical protein
VVTDVNICDVVAVVAVADVGGTVVAFVVELAVVVVVEVDFAQDVKTSDTTMRQVSVIQIAPLFIMNLLLFYSSVVLKKN